MDELARTSHDILWIGNLEKLFRALPEREVFMRVTAKRIRGRTATRAITDKATASLAYFKKTFGSYRTFRIADHFSGAGVLAIWGDTIALLNPENSFSVTLVHDKNIASLARDMFQRMWTGIGT